MLCYINGIVARTIMFEHSNVVTHATDGHRNVANLIGNINRYCYICILLVYVNKTILNLLNS